MQAHFLPPVYQTTIKRLGMVKRQLANKLGQFEIIQNLQTILPETVALLIMLFFS
jgi:hypothetical protein